MTLAAEHPASTPDRAHVILDDLLPSIFNPAVPLDLIDFFRNVRIGDGEDPGLTASVVANGVIQPVSLIDRGARYDLWLGHRRFAASLAAGRESIPAQIYQWPGDYAFDSRQLAENLGRRDMSEPEIFKACLALEQGGASRGKIGNTQGVSGGTITKWMSPKDCPPEAIEKFFAGLLTLGQMYKISVSDEPLLTMGLFLKGETHAKAARKAAPRDAVRVESVKVPLPGGQVVTVKGEGVSLEEAAEAMDEAKKAINAAIKRGLNAKTAQRVFADVAAAG